jgi:hypothetical protein
MSFIAFLQAVDVTTIVAVHPTRSIALGSQAEHFPNKSSNSLSFAVAMTITLQAQAVISLLK